MPDKHRQHKMLGINARPTCSGLRRVGLAPPFQATFATIFKEKVVNGGSSPTLHRVESQPHDHRRTNPIRPHRRRDRISLRPPRAARPCRRCRARPHQPPALAAAVPAVGGLRVCWQLTFWRLSRHKTASAALKILAYGRHRLAFLPCICRFLPQNPLQKLNVNTP